MALAQLAYVATTFRAIAAKKEVNIANAMTGVVTVKVSTYFFDRDSRVSVILTGRLRTGSITNT